MNDATYLLDTSFLIDFADETEGGVKGPARRLAERFGKRAYISAVSFSEFVEGAESAEAAKLFLSQFRFQTLGMAVAERCALNQARSGKRMGENDAWQAALAVVSRHKLVGHDDAFKDRPWLDYIDHRRF